MASPWFISFLFHADLVSGAEGLSQGEIWNLKTEGRAVAQGMPYH